MNRNNHLLGTLNRVLVIFSKQCVISLVILLASGGCYSRHEKIRIKLPIVLSQMEPELKEGYISSNTRTLDPWVDDLGRPEVVNELMIMAKENTPYPNAVLWMIKAYGSHEQFLEASKLLPNVDTNRFPPMDR